VYAPPPLTVASFTRALQLSERWPSRGPRIPRRLRTAALSQIWDAPGRLQPGGGRRQCAVCGRLRDDGGCTGCNRFWVPLIQGSSRPRFAPTPLGIIRQGSSGTKKTPTARLALPGFRRASRETVAYCRPAAPRITRGRNRSASPASANWGRRGCRRSG